MKPFRFGANVARAGSRTGPRLLHADGAGSPRRHRVAEILESPYVLIGTADRLAEDLHARRERWGISYYVTFEADMDAFAPVVARLAGR
jgi:hypothetical protein